MIKTDIYFKTLSSTSDYLKDNYQDFSSFTFVQAGYQTSGRGQFDRSWHSNENENLLFSFLIKDIDINQLDDIKKTVLFSIIELLENYHIHATYKPPNDIYVNGRKICGILIENLTELNRCLYVVVGIGLNVNQTAFEGFQATSIKQETGFKVEVSHLYTTLTQHLYERIRK
ncbi:MAG: biotin--[acetyl-CoA-carboxylase] ligase [Acholeplasmataceae bacterium]|nr:biotin--[acetyl-CoA-carboxylase] ligase [Acholeplasmataceae bacterium]